MSLYQLANKTLSYDLYQECVSETHFLRVLKFLFPWGEYAKPLLALAKNEHGGRPRIQPEVLLKMLFLGFLYNCSDREVEILGNENIPTKYFLGLPINGKAPDHSLLSIFRDEVLELKGVEFFRSLFEQIIIDAQKKGVVFGNVNALDSTHTLSLINGKTDTHDVNTHGTKPKDPDASWGVKGHETKITPKGVKVPVLKTFYGYKAHLLSETIHGLLTNFHVSTGSLSDLDGGDWLLHRILTNEQRINIHTLLADKGYGCPVWINYLEKYDHILTAFSLPETMTKRGEHKQKWVDYTQNEGRQAYKRDRYMIERTNADLKENHGLKRCRYRGLKKYFLQTALSSIAHNVKIIVKLLTGARLQPA